MKRKFKTQNPNLKVVKSDVELSEKAQQGKPGPVHIQGTFPIEVSEAHEAAGGQRPTGEVSHLHSRRCPLWPEVS
jgi:hypothetical protein